MKFPDSHSGLPVSAASRLHRIMLLVVSLGLGASPAWPQDAAPPHDPFTGIKLPQLVENADKLPVGGLGVFLIGQFCTLKCYERRGDRNVIELCVPRMSPQDAAKTS